MGGKENERFGSSPQFKRRLRVVALAYLIIGVMFSFQNCGRVSKTVSDPDSLTITNLSGLGLRDQSAEVGDRVELIASFQNIPVGAEFHWTKNGEPFGMTLNNVNFIASVALTDSGTYGVRVLSAGQVIGEAAMRLTVTDPNSGGGGGDTGGDSESEEDEEEETPTPDPEPQPQPDPENMVAPQFLQQPASQNVVEGDSISLVSYASGTPTPTYQWQKNGVDLPGETGAILYLTNVSQADEATYRVRAVNSEGMTLSAEVYVDVSQPQSQGCIIDNNYLIPPGQSAISQCEGRCQGLQWVGHRTVYYCDMNSNLTTDYQQCGNSKFKSLQCIF